MPKLYPLIFVLALSLGGCTPTGIELSALTVQMRTPENARVPGVAFELLREGDTAPGSFKSGDRGDFAYVGITPGVYHLSVR